MKCEFRPLTAADTVLVWQMLMHAAHEPSLAAVQAQPALVRYAQGWGRPGDLGLVALADHQPVGAAWLRLWQEAEPGFGFVDGQVPELAIALLPPYRNQGIGTQLLKQLLTLAQGHYPAISLSVRADNPCLRLYQRLGFVKLDNSEGINRVGGLSFNLIYRLDPGFTMPPHPVAQPPRAPCLTLRPMQLADLEAMRSLFANTIRQVNCRDYSPAQIEIWAGSATDRTAWRTRLAKSQVWVADSGGQVVGFTTLEADGHIDLFYVHYQYQGLGIGRRLLAQVETGAVERGLARLYTEASLTAKPFFLRHGFQVLKAEAVERKAVWFDRFVMEKALR